MTNAQKTDTLLPVYLVVGEDELKRRTVLDRLRKRLERRGDIAFNSDEFDGAVATGEAVVAACNTVPFASDVRLVQVDAADK
ncbi:MAG TPA: DNA polymerase III subunit delta, partial [Candidatus Aveggerthella excrementigallinarum]|nr:DNA polymerase III subunit delta [Candidatus Aveggerthella excrementigallinarum]